MPWQLLSWLLAFGAQSGLLGINLWKLVQLTDLESDYVNPYDASKNCNQLVVPEIVVQCIIVVVHFIGRHWISGCLHVGALFFLLNELWNGKLYVEATEIIRESKARRRRLIQKMVFHLMLFAWTAYKFVICIIGSLLTPEGKLRARSVLREAAATLHI